jgi:pyruvate dehydrogenase E2 component (dihydrolipoamide acetyltransferase)
MTELTDFRMPALGADMEKGTVLEWRVKPGDEVHRGQIVAEVDTAKSAIEIEVFADGVVDSIVVPTGQEVPVGAVLARLRPSAEAPTGRPLAPDHPAASEPANPRALAAPMPATAPPEAEPDHLRIAPVLRRLAQERAVDLAAVTGSGPHGRITRADIERSAAAVPRAEPATTTVERVRSSPLARRRAAAAGVDLASLVGSGPGGAVTAADVAAHRGSVASDTAPSDTALSDIAPSDTAPSPSTEPAPTARRGRRAVDQHPGMRGAIGGLMRRSKREIPHYYLATTVDLHAALDWLAAHNAALPVADRILPVAVMLRATVRAATDYPDFNGHFVTNRFRPADSVRLGVPVSLRAGGLVTPSIDAAEHLTLAQLNVALRDLATRAKTGKLRGSDLGDPSLTVTSLGDRGVETVFGVIFPPQVALVGFGSIVHRPWASDGLLGVRPVVTATLSADHRVSDGHRGALFLAAIRQYLDRPEDL